MRYESVCMAAVILLCAPCVKGSGKVPGAQVEPLARNGESEESPVKPGDQGPARYPGRALMVAFRFLTRTSSLCQPSFGTPLGV